MELTGYTGRRVTNTWFQFMEIQKYFCLFFFLLYLPFFDFDFGHRLFSSCLFLVGTMLVSSVSVSVATRLACNIHMYLDTYVRWSHLLILVWGIRFVSVIVCIIFCFYLFPLEVIFRSCDHKLHCSHDLIMWEQQNLSRSQSMIPN